MVPKVAATALRRRHRRSLVVVFQALLHLWVMIVLLTYQPEVHGLDFNPHES